MSFVYAVWNGLRVTEPSGVARGLVPTGARLSLLVRPLCDVPRVAAATAASGHSSSRNLRQSRDIEQREVSYEFYSCTREVRILPKVLFILYYNYISTNVLGPMYCLLKSIAL